ncbi:uncharacterized protein LOC118262690 [Spodoptera frugiperda]|uniref:Uncharacterized protein LOC118262690 n=1 Tax=Spodoptera frugiperda TaxID=7108 RepID=A0A9R0CUW1_SPOFR|nr:uncharacterized protein LOC118262690 [Spodoptera frugiperda]
MKGYLIVLSVVYSVQAWQEIIGPIHVTTATGTVPLKYHPLTADDKHATRKAGTLVSFLKNVPQLNPFAIPSLGPYSVNLPEVRFHGNLHLSNVVVNGIRSLSLVGLEVRMDPSRIDFNASLPEVSAEINFAVNGELDGKPLNVNGHASANAKHIIAEVAVGPVIAQHGNNQVYEVKDADVVINVSQVELAMQMDQHAEEFRGIVVEFLNNTNKYSLVVDDILRAVLKAISHELKQITAKEILQYLLGSAKPSSLL